MGFKEISKGRFTEWDSNIIEFQSRDGRSILIETDVRPVLGSGGASRGSVSENEFDKSLELILETIGSSATRKIQNLNEMPDEIKIEFGIKFKPNAGVVIASGEDQANLKVSLKWTRNNRIS